MKTKAKDLGQGLVVRFAILMTMAMLPIGAIALWQSNRLAAMTGAGAQAAVLAETERVAVQKRQSLQYAVGVANGLGAAVADSLSDARGCAAVLDRFLSENGRFTYAAFSAPDGTLLCSAGPSAGAPVGLADSPAATEVGLSDPDTTGAASFAYVRQPIRTDGVARGTLLLTLPYDLDILDRAAGSGVEYVALATSGDVLAPSALTPEMRAFLPRDAFSMAEGTGFFAAGGDGQERYYTVAALIPGEAALMGVHPASALLQTGQRRALALNVAFSVLMWLAGIVVSFQGLYRFVIRHLDAMRRAMRRFAEGDHAGARVTLDGPPAELAALEQTFNRMIDMIVRADARREEDLREKTVLLREVHHRVKNNLQLIASIMNMHSRAASSPESRRLLAQLQRRVRGLSTVHQTLSASARMTTVDAQQLIDSLIRELGPTSPLMDQRVEISSDVDPVPLGADQAVALSMLAAEALTNAVKFVGTPKGHRPRIHVELLAIGEGDVCFCIENTKASDRGDLDETLAGSGLGHRLMQAFVSQLGGRADQTETETMFRYAVTFPLQEPDTDDTSEFGSPSALA